MRQYWPLEGLSFFDRILIFVGCHFLHISGYFTVFLTLRYICFWIGLFTLSFLSFCIKLLHHCIPCLLLCSLLIDLSLLSPLLSSPLLSYSGGLGSVIANPTDLVKIRFQSYCSLNPNPYRHTAEAFVDIYRNEGGVKGLYKVWLIGLISFGV